VLQSAAIGRLTVVAQESGGLNEALTGWYGIESGLVRQHSASGMQEK
jgi:hypothetical protein